MAKFSLCRENIAKKHKKKGEIYYEVIWKCSGS